MMKNWFKKILTSLIEKSVVGILFVVLKVIFYTLIYTLIPYLWYKVHILDNKSSNNPAMKSWHYHTVITDEVTKKVQNELVACKATGIYTGLFTVSSGVGKFIFLQGVWDFGFSGQQKLIMEKPQQYTSNQDIVNIIQKASIGLPLLGNGSTKHTNNLYLHNFTHNSVPCRLDAETMQKFASHDVKYQVLDINEDSVATTFSECIKRNINIKKFTKDLEKIYIYPIRYNGLEMAFLTLSFQTPEEGQCFSNDRMKQGIFFDKIRHIINENVVYV